MMSANWLDRLILSAAPAAGARRIRARAAARVLMNYDAATTGRRSRSWRPNALNADAAAARRDRISYVSRDMIRNTPLASRAKSVIVGNVVGDGIIPSIDAKSKRIKERGLALIKAHLDTTKVDADGRNNLYGLQRLVFGAVVESGEVLVRRRRRQASDGLPLPFQIQVLEIDHLDTSRDGKLSGGNVVREGIEYDAIGRRVAYWLFEDHPGALGWRRLAMSGLTSKRIPASDVLHIYRQDRPGQMRGVSWFAPIALAMQDLGDYRDAHLVRQKIAACFAAFRVDLMGDGAAMDQDAAEDISSISPGAIQTLSPGEDIRFSSPPPVEGFEEFTRGVARELAAGMGITYEALTGDLSNVNFSSARMGRVEMDRNVTDWQWLLLIPQFMHPLTEWFLDAWAMIDGVPPSVGLKWTPPRRVLVDPTKELPAMGEAVRLGFQSRSDVVRSLGYDPEDVNAEIAADNAAADELGLGFDSDGRRPKNGMAPATPKEAGDESQSE